MHSAPVPINVRCYLSAQPVEATQALNLSAGVSNVEVLRGRKLMRCNKFLIVVYMLGRRLPRGGARPTSLASHLGE